LFAKGRWSPKFSIMQTKHPDDKGHQADWHFNISLRVKLENKLYYIYPQLMIV